MERLLFGVWLAVRLAQVLLVDVNGEVAALGEGVVDLHRVVKRLVHYRLDIVERLPGGVGVDFCLQREEHRGSGEGTAAVAKEHAAAKFLAAEARPALDGEEVGGLCVEVELVLGELEVVAAVEGDGVVDGPLGGVGELDLLGDDVVELALELDRCLWDVLRKRVVEVRGEEEVVACAVVQEVARGHRGQVHAEVLHRLEQERGVPLQVHRRASLHRKAVVLGRVEARSRRRDVGHHARSEGLAVPQVSLEVADAQELLDLADHLLLLIRLPVQRLAERRSQMHGKPLEQQRLGGAVEVASAGAGLLRGTGPLLELGEVL